MLRLEVEHLQRVREAGLDDTVARMTVESREHQLARLKRILEHQAARMSDRR